MLTPMYQYIVPGYLGCTWKNECKKVNETWQDGCHHFQCVWSNTDTGFVAVINATSVCKSTNPDMVFNAINNVTCTNLY